MSGNHTLDGVRVGRPRREYARSARQRLVLHCLVEEGGVSDLVTLSMKCAARLHDRPANQVPLEARRRLFSDLADPAVRALDCEGLVEYDDSRGTVRLRERPPL